MKKILLILGNCIITIVLFQLFKKLEVSYLTKIITLVILQIIFVIELFYIDKLFLKNAFFIQPKKIGIYVLSIYPILLYNSFNLNFENFSTLPLYRIVSKFFGIASFEEILIRLLVFVLLFKFLESLKTRKTNLIISIVLSSFIFGLLHLNNLSVDFSFALRQVYTSFCVGCLLATIFIKTGNITALFVVHFLMNFLGDAQASIGLMLSDSFLEESVESLLFFIIFGSPLIITVFLIYRFKYQNAIKIKNKDLSYYI